jgi:hypothetical protein
MKKMCNIFNHQENANQNCIKILTPVRMAIIKKKKQGRRKE